MFSYVVSGSLFTEPMNFNLQPKEIVLSVNNLTIICQTIISNVWKTSGSSYQTPEVIFSQALSPEQLKDIEKYRKAADLRSWSPQPP